VKLFGQLKRNSPAVAEAFFTELNRAFKHRDLDWKFDVEFHRSCLDMRRADVSRLRAAHLVTFATFGFRFILQKPCNAVRAGIADPTSDAIEISSSVSPILTREPGI
jgi:hypothetical protein